MEKIEKFVKLRLDSLPRIMFSHTCVIGQQPQRKMAKPYFELTVFDEGRYSFRTDGKVWEEEAGSFIFIPAGTVATVKWLTERLRMSCIAFFLDCEAETVGREDVVVEKYDNHIKTVNESLYIPLIGSISSGDGVSETVRRIIAENKAGGPFTNIKCADMIVDLLVQLSAAAVKNVVAERSAPSNKYYCDKVDRFLLDNYSEEIDMNDIAEHVSLHPNYLSSLYRHETSHTIMEALRSIRIEHAKRYLLMQKYSVKEIAHLCGFADENYFSAVFKKCEGVTPSKFVISLLKNE